MMKEKEVFFENRTDSCNHNCTKTNWKLPFRLVAPNIELLHFMDTSLLSLMEKSGKLTPEIIRRFSALVNLAYDSDVSCIQLTYSAF